MSAPPPTASVVGGMRKLAAAAVGLVIGVLLAVLVLLVITVIHGNEDREHIEALAKSNQERLSQQASGVAVGLDILCKLKKYDLTTGLPALKARREHGAEYDPQRAVILERALLLVLSIPSSETCLAIPEPIVPKSKSGPSPKSLLRKLEQGATLTPPALTQPPNAAPRIEREATPHKGSGHRGARGPSGSRGPAGPGSTTTPGSTSSPPPATTPTATVSAPPPPATTTPTTPTPAPPPVTKPPPPVVPAEPVKKRGPLGLCVEALGLEVLC